MKKYVAYYRVSTKGQGHDGLGIDAQKSIVRDRVKNVGAELLAEYTEVESGGNDDRPILIEATDFARANGAILLTAKLDRFSRDVAFLFTQKKKDVAFESCDLPSTDTLSLGMIATFAQHERERISERTRLAKQEQKKQIEKYGYYTAKKSGRAITKLGAEDIKAFQRAGTEAAAEKRTEEKEADERWIKARRIAKDLESRGETQRAIADSLNAFEVVTRTGGKWHAGSVNRLLK